MDARSSLRSQISWLTVWVLTLALQGCSLFDESYSDTRKKEKTATKDPNQCLAIKDGETLSKSEESTYKNVGFVLVLDNEGIPASICSGYLIKPDVVLTAQHCIANTEQVPYPTRNVIFTFTDFPTMADLQSKGQQVPFKDATEIIQWAEVGEAYRDVALIRLNEPYDFTFNPFDLKQTPVTQVDREIVMVGYGNHVDTNETERVLDKGVRRIGKARFVEYNDVPFPDFTNSDFEIMADYVSLAPFSENEDRGIKNQMVCQGDSGSSIFVDQGHTHAIAGVTSMQLINNPDEDYTSYDDCFESIGGLFVPSHQIRDWVNRELTKMDPSYALETHSTFKGKITSVKEGASTRTLEIDIISQLDDGLEMGNASVTVDICTKDCESFPTVSIEPKKNLIAHFKVVSEDSKFILKTMRGLNEPEQYRVKFNATIAEEASKEVVVNGQTLKGYVLQYVDPLNGTSPAPKFDSELAFAYICESGCVDDTKISSSGFKPKKSNGITVEGEVVHGKLFLKTVSQNPSYNSDVVEETRKQLFAPKAASNLCKK